jgi:hypothetical protein
VRFKEPTREEEERKVDDLCCAFCLQPGHHVRECTSAQEYVRLGRALVLGDRLSLPNGQPIPNDGAGRRLNDKVPHEYSTGRAQQHRTRTHRNRTRAA